MRRLQVFGQRPVAPEPAPGLARHEEALQTGKPLMAGCSGCGLASFPQPGVCPQCGCREFEARTMPETGRLYSFTRIHAAPGALARRAPYRIGLVDLYDGPRLLLPLWGVESWRPVVDEPMQLFVVEHQDGPLLAAHPASAQLSELVHESRENKMQKAHRPDVTRALVARGKSGDYAAGFEDLPVSDLPSGDVLVRISHSALNYKDALAITGRAPIIRNFPMVLGIDLAGEVAESKSPKFRPGDAVIVNGFGLSETRWGGYSGYQSLPESVLLHRPEGLSGEQAMQIGTAGYTAMLCVMALEQHGLEPARDAIVVTGASGGVGSIALSLLANRGFNVIAVTGRNEQDAFLRELGARDVISREDLSAGGKAMARERWSGAVDVAGGNTLASVIAQTKYDGIVASCGMADKGDLPTSVYPFILRGVTLRGIDSVIVPLARRKRAWEALDRELDRKLLAKLSQTREFSELPQLANDLLDGRLRGRIAIRIAGE